MSRIRPSGGVLGRSRPNKLCEELGSELSRMEMRRAYGERTITAYNYLA